MLGVVGVVGVGGVPLAGRRASSVGITVYKLARIMGTSVSMIEAHYGALLDTAHTGLLDRLESFGALEGHEQKAEDA